MNIRILTVPMLAAALLACHTAGAMAAEAEGDSTRMRMLDDVVVTGTNHAMNRNLLPYTVSVMGSREIEGTGRAQLLSAISGQVPSLFISERNVFGFGVSNGGSGGIKIRGVGNSPTSGILMMVDGQPQFAGLFSHPVADFYDSEYVDHVEILRGPGSVLYGSNAMGGVINVITKRPEEGGVNTTLSSQFGSYNTWQSALTNTIRSGRFHSLVSLRYGQTDGVRKNFDFKQKSLYAKMGYDLSRQWTLAADYSLMNFVGNDPVYAKLSNPESEDIYHQNVTRGEASLSLSNSWQNTNGAVRLYYSYGNHYIDDPRHFHSLDDRFGLLAYQSFRPWNRAMATVGFDFDTYTGRIPMSGGNQHAEGSMSTISRKSITEYSPYVTLSQELFSGVLSLNGGLRMANSDRFGTHWIPQLGLSLRPADGWNVKASLARGYRNPSFRELYLYRPANADLEPERMMNYEIGLSRRFSRHLEASLTGYFSEGSNMIQTVDMKNQNTGNFINKGIELSLESNPIDALRLRAGYSYMHTNLRNLTAAPKNQYYLGAMWQAMPQLSFDVNLKGVGGLYVGSGVENQNYALLGVKVDYQPLRWLELFANFDNITDAHYVINHGYDMPGFTAMGGFKLRF